MKLRDYLAREELTTAAFAKKVGITTQALGRYLAGQRVPKFDVLWRIEVATGGAVTANDFHLHRRYDAAVAE